MYCSIVACPKSTFLSSFPSNVDEIWSDYVPYKDLCTHKISTRLACLQPSIVDLPQDGRLPLKTGNISKEAVFVSYGDFRPISNNRDPYGGTVCMFFWETKQSQSCTCILDIQMLM